MNPLEEARALLPTWVPLVNLGWVPLAFVLSLFATWLAMAIAVWPLRCYRGESWVERARLLYPVRFVSLLCSLGSPIFLGFAAYCYASPLGYVSAVTLGILGGLAAYAGYLVMHIRCQRRWGPMSYSWVYWLRGTLLSWLVFLPHILVLVGIALFLPDSLNLTAIAILSAGTPVYGFFIAGGGLLLAAALGLARPA